MIKLSNRIRCAIACFAVDWWKQHPLFRAGYDAGLHDAKLEAETLESEDAALHPRQLKGREIIRVGDPDNWTVFESAPSDVPIWCVYGDDNWLQFIVCRKRDYPGRNSALWGYSVYRRQAGFRTLGVGSDWCIEHKCRFFANQEDGLAYLRRATTPKASAC